MRPQHCCCGNRVVLLDLSVLGERFNEAAALLLRKSREVA